MTPVEAGRAKHRALTAIGDELEALDLPRAIITAAPVDIRAQLVNLVAAGLCTAAQAAEALSLTFELADATERGELDQEQGHELMQKLGYRHIGKVKSD